MKSISRVLGGLILTALLAVSFMGCGGGGGDGGGTTGTVPSAPTGVAATAGNGQVTISWTAATGATSYNIYWSTTSGVTKTTGTKISNVTSPYTHTGLTNGTTYYHVVSAVNSYGESAESSQISAIPNVMPIAEWIIDSALWGIAVDNAGDVYVSEFFDSRIKKFTSTGTYITQWGSAGIGIGQFALPKYIAVDGNNNLYVPDASYRVQKFTSTGVYITYWGGTLGTGNGQFNTVALAVDITNKWVYVVDGYNNRIQKFDLSGVYITKWGSYGTGNSQFKFSNPDGSYILGSGAEGAIAVDKAGMVYVVDNMNHRIQKFDSSGTYITKWGTQGSGTGQFLFPSGIAIDNTNGWVYVINSSNCCGGIGEDFRSRIEKFDLDGNFINRWVLRDLSTGDLASAVSVAINSSTGEVYVAQGNRVAKYAP